MTASLTKWYEEHGRHEIFAGGKNVNLDNTTHKLVLNQIDVAHKKQTDLDDAGILKNARQEKFAARDAKLKQQAHNAEMAKLYREHILGEKQDSGFVPLAQLGGIAPAPPKKVEENKEVGSFGD